METESTVFLIRKTWMTTLRMKTLEQAVHEVLAFVFSTAQLAQGF